MNIVYQHIYNYVIVAHNPHTINNHHNYTYFCTHILSFTEYHKQQQLKT